MGNPIQVLVYEGRKPLSSFLLTPGSSVTLGRGAEADVRLISDGISRVHLKLSYDENGVWACDQGSTNGSFVAGVRLPRTPTRLDPDLMDLKLGELRIVFRYAQNTHLRETRKLMQTLLADRDISIRFCNGVGSHGSVWVGWQRSLRRHVAVKVISSEEHFERFQREAMLYTKISDASVVRCFDFVRRGDHSLLLMEYVHGVSLAEHVRQGPLDVDTALSVGEDIATALVALEERGVIHRDVKPSNVLLDLKGHAKLCDMGIGKDLTEHGGITLPGCGLGSLHYMAPEQMRDASSVGHEADLYALGATLYHMLAGEPPPLANPQLYTPSGIRAQGDTPAWLERNPRPLDEIRADCPPPVARFVEKLLRDDPAERAPSASVAREALRWLRDGLKEIDPAERPTRPHAVDEPPANTP